MSIRIRDLTSGDTHDLPASTRCIERAYRGEHPGQSLALTAKEAASEEGYTTLGAAAKSPRPTTVGWSVALYVRSDDPAEGGRGRRLWWAAQVLTTTTTTRRGEHMTTHRHRAIPSRHRVIGWGHCVAAPGACCAGLAHGAVTHVDTCSCGATRSEESNGFHRERGLWIPAPATKGR